MTDQREIRLPAMGLVLLVGVSGSGKSTFAHAHFAPTEVVSSDVCRGLVSDDENDQSATRDAFDLLHHLVGIRLRRGLLTVVDATNVQPAARASLIKVAKAHDVLTDAIVLDVPESVAIARNEARPDRTFGSHVVTRQQRDLRRGMKRLRREGFRRVHTLEQADLEGGVRLVREPSWNDRRDLTGPFDLIGDVHGCAAELRALLETLGYELTLDEEGRAVGATHPAGRTAVFVGDLVDRGPDTPGVLRLVMGMVAAGDALCVAGNHEVKLVRALGGRDVKVAHGLAESLEQLAAESEEFRAEARAFMDGLVSHYVLDDGRLVVAHAGLKQSYHGRSSGRVRAFALYGDTTGETDEFGLPVRYPWAQEYRGDAVVVYGHTPVPAAEWVNNTICLDTGVVFGGELTALRYPERELVAEPAHERWYEPVRPLDVETTRSSPPPSAGHPVVEERGATRASRNPGVLRLDDVAGDHWLETAYAGRVKIPAENAAAALEVMSRFAVDPRWLVHLPATMSPVTTSRREGFLEHPEEAFEEYAKAGVGAVVCQEKHMGSRAIVVLCRDAEVAARRFDVHDGVTGAVLTRTGRPFFDPETTERLLAELREPLTPLMDRLASDWLVLDAELLPWSVKAEGLIKSQYASVGAAATHALPAVQQVLEMASARGLDIDNLAARTEARLANAAAYREAYGPFVGSPGLAARLAPRTSTSEGLAPRTSTSEGLAPRTSISDGSPTTEGSPGVAALGLAARLAPRTSTSEGLAPRTSTTDGPAARTSTTETTEVQIAPFAVLASESGNHAAEQPHRWHTTTLAELSPHPRLRPTRHLYVDLADPEKTTAQRAAATEWWEQLTVDGGEGMVVKPADMPPGDLARGRAQPGVKVRGREYLRIVYGPDYTASLDVLRDRHLGRKRSLAQREHALGLAALDAFVAREPLWRVHQLVFGVLALESEGVDPRL